MERGISALGSDCEEPGPSCDPGRDRCWFGGGGDGGGFVLGEQAQELHRLGAKPATDLNAIFCFFFFFSRLFPPCFCRRTFFRLVRLRVGGASCQLQYFFFPRTFSRLPRVSEHKRYKGYSELATVNLLLRCKHVAP